MNYGRDMPVVSVPDQMWADLVGEVPGVDVVTWDLSEDHPRASDIEIVVPPYQFGSGRLGRLASLPRLRYVQALTAGYDHMLKHLPDGVGVANARGVHDASTAELAVGLVLASLRGIDDFARSQSRGVWERPTQRKSLADRKVLIIGYGSIGSAIARRLAPFEVELTAVASAARAGDDLVERVHGFDEVNDLLPAHDVVILMTPLTPTTQGMVDAEFLSRMPDGALLVNMARGKVVDTDALVAECASGRLSAAADVTDPEPLPEGHPMLTTPGILVSPHVGGDTTAFFPRAARLLRTQFAQYADSGSIEHVCATGGGAAT